MRISLHTFTRLLILVFILSIMTVHAQQMNKKITKTSEGTEFWLCFQENSWHHSANRVGKMKLTDARGGDVYIEDRSTPNFELFISSDVTTKIRIEIEGIRYKLDTTVVGGTVRRISIPAAAEVTGDGTLQPNAVRITSKSPISVTCLNERGSSTDSYLALPATALGLEYYAMSYHSTPTNDLVSHMAIVATQDSTIVYVTPSVMTSRNKPPKVAFPVIMNKGDVYQIAALNFQPMSKSFNGSDTLIFPDLTGTRIQASKPVAVFSGHQCADVPLRVPFCNYLVEQLPPVHSWGKHFILGQFAKRSSYVYRVIASKPQTKIFENSVFIRELQAGEMYENSSVGSNNIMLTASEPVLVAQFSQGFLGGAGPVSGRVSRVRGDSIGDPMMLVVSPTQQFLTEYRFATPKTSYTNWKHFVNIIVPSSSVESLRFNGRLIDTMKYAPEFVGLSNYVAIKMDVPFGVHTVKADVPFGLYSYGFATNDAYGNMIGQGFEVLQEVVDTLPPSFERRNLENSINVVIRDERSEDKGLERVRVLSTQGLLAIEKGIVITEAMIMKGTPQYTLFVKPAAGVTKGMMEIEAKDIAGNISTFILQYEGSSFQSKVEQKPIILPEKNGWEWGAYAIASAQFHDVNSPKTIGMIDSPSGFQAESSSPLGLGLHVGTAGTSTFKTMFRMEYLPYSVILRGQDTNAVQVYDSLIKNYVPFRESTVLQADLPTLAVSGGFRWDMHDLLYLFAMGQASFIPNKQATAFRHIDSPLSFTYVESGTRELSLGEKTLDEVSSLWFSVNIGFGLQKQVSQTLTLFGEAQYQTVLNSILNQVNNSATWNFASLRCNIGIKSTF